MPDVAGATEKGLCFTGHPRVHSKGAGPSAPQFWRFLSTAYTIYRGTTIFDVVTRVGHLGAIDASHPKKTEFLRCPILGFSYTLKRRSTKFGMVRVTRGRVLGSQSRYCVCTNASRGLSATAEFIA